MEGPCTGGVYITNNTSSGFSVVQQGDSTSNASFSFRISGKRKYFEDLRFASEAANKTANDNMAEAVWSELNSYVAQQRQQMSTLVNSQSNSPAVSTMPQYSSPSINEPSVNITTVPAITPMVPRNYPASPTPAVMEPPTY